MILKGITIVGNLKTRMKCEKKKNWSGTDTVHDEMFLESGFKKTKRKKQS